MDAVECLIARHQAEAELRNEAFTAAVAAEKLKILASRGQSPWSRFLAWLPFTFTWKTK